jgi:hypothetical protein
MPNRLFWLRLIILASCLFLSGLVLGGIMMPKTALTQSTTPQGGRPRQLRRSAPWPR